MKRVPNIVSSLLVPVTFSEKKLLDRQRSDAQKKGIHGQFEDDDEVNSRVENERHPGNLNGYVSVGIL